ncbi:MAG: putative hydroxymethylpyrimidine transport system substrate-binding protein [Thermoleophilaceae bacterium]|nr:putative hydroxymethylpyrimidine transport system substrate-binding protein [Thermoleophilaceae bacterium]
MSTRVVVALLAVGAALMAGCGERKETIKPGRSQPLSLMLDYFANADHAPIYAGLASGAFRDVGLDLRIRQPSDPAAPIKQVAAGRVDLAVSYEPEVLRARDQGLPVTAVAALVQKPLTSIISLPGAGITGPEDLAYRTVGTAGIDYQHAFLQAILQRAHVDPTTVTERNLGFNLVPGLVSGQADAILGGFWNYEGIQLKQEGRDPQIIRVDEAGVPAYDELVLVANEDEIANDPDPIRRFIGALSRGEAALERDPQPGLDALQKANPDLDPKLQRAAVRVTVPLFEAPNGKPYGWLEPKGWAAFGNFMVHAGLLKSTPDAKAYTNTLLPGQGLPEP